MLDQWSYQIQYTRIYDMWLGAMVNVIVFNATFKSSPVFCGVRVVRSLVFCVMFCTSLLVLLYLSFRPLCFLSFFDLRLLITHFASSNFSCGPQNTSLKTTKTRISANMVLKINFYVHQVNLTVSLYPLF
jgi:hypothetical protein